MADYYWQGAKSNAFNDPDNWVTASGGSTTHTTAPGSSDDLFYDAASFGQECDFATAHGLTVKSITVQDGLTQSVLLNTVAARSLTIKDTLTVNEHTVFAFAQTFTFIFDGSGTQFTVYDGAGTNDSSVPDAYIKLGLNANESMFSSETVRGRITFDFTQASGTNSMTLVDGKYPIMTNIGTVHAKYITSDSSATAFNTYGSVDILDWSDGSVRSTKRNIYDYDKEFFFEALTSVDETFQFGHTTARFKSGSSNFRLPVLGDVYTNFGNNTTNTFNVQYHKVIIDVGDNTSNYAYIQVGKTLDCNELVIRDGGRLYGPAEGNQVASAKIKSVKRPTVQGDWNFKQIADGIYESIGNIPTLPVTEGGTGLNSVAVNSLLIGQGQLPLSTLAMGSANQVLKVNSGGTALEFGAVASTGISGSIADTQVAFGTGTDTIGGEADFTYDTTDNVLEVDKILSHIVIKVQNDTGSSIPKGQAVYVDAEGTHPSVAPALATDSTKMPSIGLAQEALATTGSGYVCVNGIITVSSSIIDDTLSDPGDVGKTLYVSETTAGNLTITKPTSPNDLVQNVGKIADITGSNVKIIVSNIGRSNDVPNTISIEGDITSNGNISALDGNIIGNTFIAGYDTGDAIYRTYNTGDHLELQTYDAGTGGFVTELEILNDQGGIQITNDLTVGGDLTVSGTTTTLNTQTVEVEDNILQLNTTQGSPDTATDPVSGIEIYRGNGVSVASFKFLDNSSDRWQLYNGTAAMDFYMTGSVSEMSANSNSLYLTTKRDQDDIHLRTGTTETTRMYIDGGQDYSGYVGIGTVTPASPLHVYHSDNTGIPGITIETNGGAAQSDSKLRIKESHGSATWVDFTVNTFGQLEITGGATTRRQIFTADEPDTDDLGVISLNKDHYEWDTQIFGDSSTPVIYVDGTNNRMGVGLTNPSTALEVSGTLTVGNAALESNQFRINNTGGYGQIELGGSSGAFIDLKSPFSPDDYDLRLISSGSGGTIQTSGNANLGISVGTGAVAITGNVSVSTGNVTVSSTLPLISLIDTDATNDPTVKIYNNNGNMSLRADSENVGTGGVIDFQTSGSEKMRLTDAGNLGIGTTSPDAPLHVEHSSGLIAKFGEGNVETQMTFADARAMIGYVGDSLMLQGGAGNKFVRFAVNNGTFGSGEVARFDTSGNFGLGTTTPSGLLDVRTGSGFAIKIGADVNTTSLTDSTRKFARIGLPHYTNAEEPVTILTADSESGYSRISIGGGTGSGNAPSQIFFYAESDTTTLSSGSARAAITSAGLGVGETSPTFPLHVKYTDNRTDPEGSGSASGAGAIGADAEGGGLYIENLSTTDGSWSGVTFRTDTADARIAYQSVGTGLINEGQMSFFLDANDTGGNQLTLQEVLRLRGGGSGASQTFNSVDLPTNDARLRLGASQQLELKFDGSHTRITHDAATDSWMIFKNEDGAGFQFNIGTDKGIEINKNGNVELYYDNSKKIETTTAGATVTGTVSATAFSGEVQPKATTEAGDNNSTDHYAKLLTFNPGGSTTRDCNLILGVTAHDQGSVGSAIISVKFRSNGTTSEYTADVAFMSKSGNSIFDKDAFQIFSDGNLVAQDNNTDMELWVKKNNNYSALEVHEISKAITGGNATLTYHTDSSWQSSAPTNNAFTTTTQGIELNLDEVRMGVAGSNTYLYLHPNTPNSFLLATTSGDVTLAGDDDLVLHADDDIIFQAGAATQMTLLNTGELGIGTTTPGHKLEVNGSFAATTKSFDIEHPTKEGMRLHHGSLEGPEHGVYVRGRLEGDVIDLPDYWLGLVDKDTITVQLTANRSFQQLYVDEIADNKIYVGTQTDTPIDCFYFVQAERKDVDKMEVEY